MKFEISNVKVSIKTSPISLNNVLEINLPLKSYKNYVVVKSKYTYSIFKTNSHLENHINITKIPNLKEVLNSIEHLKKYLNFSVKQIKVDNIIATLNIQKPIDLVSVCEKKLFESIKYNNEKFPGLFVKFKEGTAILFHSGKIVLVGCKTKKDLKCLTLNICAVIK